jgi:hypothetical protein
MSQVPKYSTYSLTVRPRECISDSQVSKTVEFIKKYCTYWHGVTEKLEHERHVHAALYLKTPTARSYMLTAVMRLAEKLGLDFDERSVLRGGLKILYNHGSQETSHSNGSS